MKSFPEMFSRTERNYFISTVLYFRFAPQQRAIEESDTSDHEIESRRLQKKKDVVL